MATKKPKKKPASNFVPYSTKDNFNPLEDFNVGIQTPRRYEGKADFKYVIDRAGGRTFPENRPLNTGDYNFINDFYKSKERLPGEHGQPAARYESKDSARIAAQHNAGITYDRDIGYVPRAEAVNAAANVSAMPKYDPKISAENAARRADVYAKEAARQLKNGNTKSASEWQALSDQARAKAGGSPAPKPAAPAASNSSKPATPPKSGPTAKPEQPPASQTAQPKSSVPDWSPAKPSAPFVPLNYDSKPPAAESPSSTARQNKLDSQRKAIGTRPQEIKQSDIDSIKKRAAQHEKDRETYVKHAEAYEKQGNKEWAERMWKDAEMADKAATLAKKNAEQMEKDKPVRDQTIAEWDEKKKNYDKQSAGTGDMGDIKPLSSADGATMPSDPMQNIMNGITQPDAFAYTPPANAPKMVKAYGNKHSSVMVKARGDMA